MRPSFFLSYSSYQCMRMHTSIWSICFAWFLFSPMIAREGHEISRTYTLYLWRSVPPQGDDKMSNRSSGTAYMHTLIINAIRGWKRNGEKRKWERDKLRENESTCLFGPIKTEAMNWLVELNKKKKSTNEEKKRSSVKFLYISSFFSLHCTCVPNGSKIPSSHLTIMLLEQKQQHDSWERKPEQTRYHFILSLLFFLSLSLFSLFFPTNDRKLFPPNKSL